jgi:hypothetical protein
MTTRDAWPRQLSFPIIERSAVAPARADRVDDVLRGQVVAGGEPGVAGRAAAELAALGEQALAGAAVDRAVDPAAAEQAGVGRVDDRVDLQRGDVALEDASGRIFSRSGMVDLTLPIIEPS